MIIVHDEFGQPIWFQVSNQVTSYSIPNPLLKLPTEEEVRKEAEDECTYPEGQYRDSGTWRVALKEGGVQVHPNSLGQSECSLPGRLGSTGAVHHDQPASSA
jgi:hypothetical protein